MGTERASSPFPVPTASDLMVSLLSRPLLPAASHLSTQPCAHSYGPAQHPLITPPFPSLENPNLGCPRGTVSPIAVSDGCRLSYLSSWGGGWECRAPSIHLGTSQAPVSTTWACSSRAWPRSILSHEDLQGERRAQGVLGEGSREVGGLSGSLFPQSSLLLTAGHVRVTCFSAG